MAGLGQFPLPRPAFPTSSRKTTRLRQTLGKGNGRGGRRDKHSVPVRQPRRGRHVRRRRCYGFAGRPVRQQPQGPGRRTGQRLWQHRRRGVRAEPDVRQLLRRRQGPPARRARLPHRPAPVARSVLCRLLRRLRRRLGLRLRRRLGVRLRGGLRVRVRIRGSHGVRVRRSLGVRVRGQQRLRPRSPPGPRPRGPLGLWPRGPLGLRHPGQLRGDAASHGRPPHASSAPHASAPAPHPASAPHASAHGWTPHTPSAPHPASYGRAPHRLPVAGTTRRLRAVGTTPRLPVVASTPRLPVVASTPRLPVVASTPRLLPWAGSTRLRPPVGEHTPPPVLAHTGSEAMLAGSAVSAALIAGGTILYRRGRAASRR